jgi:hypothetical protein
MVRGKERGLVVDGATPETLPLPYTNPSRVSGVKVQGRNIEIAFAKAPEKFATVLFDIMEGRILSATFNWWIGLPDGSDAVMLAKKIQNVAEPIFDFQGQKVGFFDKTLPPCADPTFFRDTGSAPWSEEKYEASYRSEPGFFLLHVGLHLAIEERKWIAELAQRVAKTSVQELAQNKIGTEPRIKLANHLFEKGEAGWTAKPISTSKVTPKKPKQLIFGFREEEDKETHFFQSFVSALKQNGVTIEITKINEGKRTDILSTRYALTGAGRHKWLENYQFIPNEFWSDAEIHPLFEKMRKESGPTYPPEAPDLVNVQELLLRKIAVVPLYRIHLAYLSKKDAPIKVIYGKSNHVEIVKK